MINIEHITQQLKQGMDVTPEQVLDMQENLSVEQILELAALLRAENQGDIFESCSIMNARSGLCSEDCKWCSQSKFSKTKVDVYPLVSKSEARQAAQYNADKGIERFSLVTSGRGMTEREMALTCDLFTDIKANVDIKLCASLGLLNRQQLQQLYDRGVTRYHCNMETAPSFFSKLCTTHTPEDKIQTLKWAQEVGMQVCSGGIIGMGESMEQRIELAFCLQELKVNSIPINILNPIKGTPLEGAEPLSDEQILLSIAFMRIINPKAQIRLAGGRGSISHLVPKLLHCGVSAMIMGDMLTTIGSRIDADMTMVKEEGFIVK